MLAGLVVAGAAWGQAAPVTAWEPIVEVRERALLGDDGGGVEQRARLGVDVDRLGVSARVSFQDVRSWAVADGPVALAGRGPSLAEGWVRVEGDLTRKVGASLTVGRQRVTVNEGRIVGEDPWSAGGRHLDALRLVGRAAPLSFEYVGARRFGEGAAPFGRAVHVLRVGASGENPVTAWVADALWVSDGSASPTDTFGAYARFDSGRWRGRADGYVQVSEAGTATLIGLSAGWVFGTNERLAAHIRYDGFSGDEQGAAWRPVLGDTHRFNGLLDLYAAPATRADGISDAQLVVEARPAPPLAIGLTAHHFSTPRTSTIHGAELDAHVDWAFSPFVTARAVGGWFAPDPPDGDGHRLLGYVELDATF